MKHSIFSLFVILGLGFGTVGYSSETLKGVQKDYELFKEKMQSELKEVDVKIEKLKEVSKAKGQKVKEATAKDLEIAKNNLSKDLEKIQQTSSTKWQEAKKSFAASVDSLNSKVQKALND